MEELAAKKKIHVVVLGLETKTKDFKIYLGNHRGNSSGKIDCPVVIVPETYHQHRYARILAAVDYKQDLKRVVVRKAEQFAKEHKMKADLVHIQTDGSEFGFWIRGRPKKERGGKMEHHYF